MQVTAATNRTVWFTSAVWEGAQITVRADGACPVPGHALEVMHHNGPDGKDYGPTGFLWCPMCAGIADDPNGDLDARH